ncbi:hypothetical protein GCM10023324_13470 [Streptomyces youssoufiensis]
MFTDTLPETVFRAHRISVTAPSRPAATLRESAFTRRVVASAEDGHSGPDEVCGPAARSFPLSDVKALSCAVHAERGYPVGWFGLALSRRMACGASVRPFIGIPGGADRWACPAIRGNHARPLGTVRKIFCGVRNSALATVSQSST